MDNNYGKLLYEYSDAKHPLDMSKYERRQYIKSFTAIWILICTLLIAAWCIANFVLDLRLYDKPAVIKNYVVMFIILGVIILITVLTVFGLWGIFMRKVSKTYRPHEVESRRRIEELQSELQAVDLNKSRESSLTVFDNRIIIKINGKERIIDKNELTLCSMTKVRSGIFLVFYIGETEHISLNCILPSSDAYLIKKCFGNKLEIIKPPKSKRRTKSHDRKSAAGRKKTAESSAPKREREKPVGEQIEIGSLVAGAICVVVGIGVVLLGYYHVMGSMPAIVGGFPIAIGSLFVILAFYRYEFVSAFLIKFFAAALLIFMGVLFLIIIEKGVTELPVTVNSLLRHPTVYGIACLFFVSVGISIMPKAIQSLFEYIRYG